MSPFPKKITFVNPCSTPMTLAMELYNWLNDMTKTVKRNDVDLKLFFKKSKINTNNIGFTI